MIKFLIATVLCCCLLTPRANAQIVGGSPSFGPIGGPSSGGTPWFDVVSFCASGSQQQTTGSLTGGTAALTLASAIDFQTCPQNSGQPGEGITIYHAGAASTVAAPTGLSATVVGTSGTTTHSYQWVANDYYGGTSAATSAVTVTTANATLSSTNYVALCLTPSVGAASYSLWRDGVYAITTFDSTPISIIYCYQDTGYNANGQGWGNSSTSAPDWLPSSPPGAATNDWCQTTIAGGVTTTALTLAATCPTTVAAAIVKHRDTAAVQAATNACNTPAGGVVYFRTALNFNIDYIDFPDSRTIARGWIIWDNEGQITISYPITMGSPLGGGFDQNNIRITGNGGTTATAYNTPQFVTTNSGRINSGFVSPVIHVVYQNGTPVAPIVIDHIGIANRGLGGGDGIVNDGGNSGGFTVQDSNVSVTGTSLKIGYGGIGGGANGPCTEGFGFGAHIDHDTFTSYFNGNPLTNCDGWTVDIAFGISDFSVVNMIGTGIHTVALNDTQWDNIFQESGSTTGFLTYDTSGGCLAPSTYYCGGNIFRHVTLADPLGSGNTYFINTVNGSSTPIGSIEVDNAEGVITAIAGGSTPLVSCQINQNGPLATAIGSCASAAGIVNGVAFQMPVTVSSLGAATSANAGIARPVNDSTAIATPGQTCVGGGAVAAQAFSDGSTWHCSY